MQRWEYLWAIFIMAPDEYFRLRWINGELQRIWGKGPRMMELMTDWGNQRWELVSYTINTYESHESEVTRGGTYVVRGSGVHAEHIHLRRQELIFKRPK